MASSIPAVTALLASVSFELLFGGYIDTLLILALTVWKDWDFLNTVTNDHLGEDVISLAWKVLLVSIIAYVWLRERIRFVLDVGVDRPRWEGLGKPMLIPAKTTHRRTFPEKHAFSYSYLVVGVPVGWTGSVDGMISTNRDADRHGQPWFPTQETSGKSWFHVDGADHLERGPGSLKTKLHAYLKSQGLDPSTFPHAYLVTAASFLGYNFNPVSFWYLYSDAKELSAMILEVNNTFGERRMYLLEAQDCPGSAAKGKTESSKFTHAWPKDFHVSPFNSRKGSYSLAIHDILHGGPKDVGVLDGTITLKSSKEHAKIVARLFGEGDSVDPTAMNTWERARFLLAWWWVGFVTFPRIVKEAGKLFFQRKLHVWYRPEPLRTTIGREATASERQLEPIFCEYLRHLVAKSSSDLSLTYIPAGGGGEPEIMRTQTAIDAAQKTTSLQADGGTAVTSPSEQGKRPKHIDFQVLTPAFYSRFVHYAHDFEAVFAELRENQTIHVSFPELLPDVFVSKTPAAPLTVRSARDALCFWAIKAMRRPPQRIERPLTSSASPSANAPPVALKSRDTATHTVRDVRGFRISGMDGFMLGQADGQARRRYEHLVLRTFLAETLAFGIEELLWLPELVIRGILAVVISSGLSVISRQILSKVDLI